MAATRHASAASVAALPGWAEDDAAAAFASFRLTAEAILGGAAPLRSAQPAGPDLARAARAALDLPAAVSIEDARAFFADRFAPVALAADAFLTGYYEPVVDGALTPGPGFEAPVLARPDDLDACEPYPDRAAIEREALDPAGRFRPVAWLRDWVEVFLVQVQGSARVRLADGTELRLTYAGRNRHPYTSIGRLLVAEGAIAAEAMALDRLKAWLRANGQGVGARGRATMARNASYVFFAATPTDGRSGPTGGAGVPLTRLRSVAVDRTRWSYGLPFWVDARLPWTGGDEFRPFRRLLVAQDTGSAITGEARIDLFFGSGEEAGIRAGGIRHGGTAVVLLPRAVPR